MATIKMVYQVASLLLLTNMPLLCTMLVTDVTFQLPGIFNYINHTYISGETCIHESDNRYVII